MKQTHLSNNCLSVQQDIEEQNRKTTNTKAKKSNYLLKLYLCFCIFFVFFTLIFSEVSLSQLTEENNNTNLGNLTEKVESIQNIKDIKQVPVEIQEFLSWILESEKINVLFFYSKTCPHCNNVERSGVLENLHKENYNFLSFNALEFGKEFVLLSEFYNEILNENIIQGQSIIIGAVPTLFIFETSTEIENDTILILNNEENLFSNNFVALQGDTPIISYLNNLILNGDQENLDQESKDKNITNDSDKDENKPKANTLLLVILTALADSINPCIISVLALLIAQLMLVRARRKILKFGITYIFIIYASYFIIGLLIALGLSSVVSVMSTSIISSIGFYILLFIAILLFFAGIINIKDFFAYGKGLSFGLSEKNKERVKKLASKISLPSIILLGILVTVVEFPCSGIMYAGLISALVVNSVPMSSIILLLLLYNLIFVIPLILIVFFVLKGQEIEEVESKRIKYRKWFRLIMGVVLILLGFYLLRVIL